MSNENRQDAVVTEIIRNGMVAATDDNKQQTSKYAFMYFS